MIKKSKFLKLLLILLFFNFSFAKAEIFNEIKVTGNKNVAVQNLKDKVEKKLNKLLDQNPLRINFYDRYKEKEEFAGPSNHLTLDKNSNHANEPEKSHPTYHNKESQIQSG